LEFEPSAPPPRAVGIISFISHFNEGQSLKIFIQDL
jgi:hypothetical protein